MSEASERLTRRARTSAHGYVMPAHGGETQALRAMCRRGEAAPALGLPRVWVVTLSDISPEKSSAVLLSATSHMEEAPPDVT